MKLFVGIPTHSGNLCSATSETLLQTQRLLLQRGDDMQVAFFSGPVISDMRNVIVADFLNSDADLLLMLDSDTAVTGASIERLINSGKSVAGCMYPKRKFKWDAVRTPLEVNDIKDVLYQASVFVGKLESKSPERSVFDVSDGFAKAAHLGTGVLLMARRVFEQMQQAYPDLKERGFSPADFAPPRFAANWGFFNPIVPDRGPNLSEDFSFCHRWRAIGGEVWADLASTVLHVGHYTFSGNFLDYCKASFQVSVDPAIPAIERAEAAQATP